MDSNKFCICPKCNNKHRTGLREIVMYKGLAIALLRAWEWCEIKKIHEFRIGQIKHLIGSIEYTRFNDWPKFGGIVYRPEGKIKGWYGIKEDRCDRFFRNEWSIPPRVWKDAATGEMVKVDEKRIFAREIPGLIKFLDEDGFYKARYVSGPGQLTL